MGVTYPSEKGWGLFEAMSRASRKKQRRGEHKINNWQLGSERYKVEASVVENRIQCLEGKRDEMGGYAMQRS